MGVVAYIVEASKSQHMYLTVKKNLPVQTARKLVLVPSLFDDYLETNPTRHSRIFVHRVSAINKPNNTLIPDNPGGRGEGGREEERQLWHGGVSIRLPAVSPGVQVPQATPYVCYVVLFVGSRSFSERLGTPVPLSSVFP